MPQPTRLGNRTFYDILAHIGTAALIDEIGGCWAGGKCPIALRTATKHATNNGWWNWLAKLPPGKLQTNFEISETAWQRCGFWQRRPCPRHTFSNMPGRLNDAIPHHGCAERQMRILTKGAFGELLKSPGRRPKACWSYSST